jgi:virginiamycin B lyase
MRRLVTVLPGLLGVFPLAAQRADLDAREWVVPWEATRPRDPSVAPDGKVWFVGQVGNYLANLDPATGAFRRFDLDDGTFPHNQIVDKAGRIWYSGNQNGTIGRLDPRTGEITRYPMPDPAVRDPHTMVFGHDGNIWFTAQQAGFVGRLDVTSGKVDLIKVGKDGERTSPYGIAIDPRGRPWFCEFGQNRLAMIDAATMTIREYPLPDPRARPRRLAITADGAIWYGDYPRGMLGRLDPATGKVEEWASPSGALALPYGMTVDDKDRIWYAETGPRPNRLVAFDTRAKAFVVNQPVGEAQPNTIRYLVYHAPTREIWYGADLNVIGRVKVPVNLSVVP